jgi:Haem-binding domain
VRRFGLWLKRIGLAMLALLVIAQFIPVNRSNPSVDPARSIYVTEKVPLPVRDAFDRSCANCHTDHTAWPWYSRVAPASWIIADDVHHARAKLNFSEWGDYPPNKREERLEEICEQVTNGDMPDPKYLLIHRRARLAPAERDAVCQWTEDSRQY